MHRFERHCLEARSFHGDRVDAGFQIRDCISSIVAGIGGPNFAGLGARDFDLRFGDKGVVWILDGADNRAFIRLAKGGNGEGYDQQTEQQDMGNSGRFLHYSETSLGR